MSTEKIDSLMANLERANRAPVAVLIEAHRRIARGETLATEFFSGFPSLRKQLEASALVHPQCESCDGSGSVESGTAPDHYMDCPDCGGEPRHVFCCRDCGHLDETDEPDPDCQIVCSDCFSKYCSGLLCRIPSVKLQPGQRLCQACETAEKAEDERPQFDDDDDSIPF